LKNPFTMPVYIIGFVSTLICFFGIAFCQTSPVLPEDRDWQAYVQKGETTEDLNDRADRALKQLRLRMEEVMADIQEDADTQEKELLQAHQRAWERYAESKARYLADAWRGGSLESLLYANVLMKEHQRRIHELRALYAERNRP
jgi:uncharacterized protein YecT (DUF1311 family)